MDNPINYREIAQEIVKNKEESPDKSHRELVKEYVAEKINQIPPQSEISQTVNESAEVKEGGNLPPYAKSAPIESQNIVERLITLTLQKGINEGISAVKKQDPFIIDTYHDALTTIIYEELKRQNLIS